MNIQHLSWIIKQIDVFQAIIWAEYISDGSGANKTDHVVHQM
jgi:hypothetical protein